MNIAVQILLEIVFFGILYGGVIVIILSYLKVFKRKLNKLSIFLPLCIMGLFFILFIIFQFSWENGYAGLYVLVFSFIGIFLHMIVFSCIFLLINCCVKDMNKWIGLTIICFVPVLYLIYGFTISTIIKIEKVSFTHPAYILDFPLKILQLSDVHLGAYYRKPFVNTLVKKIFDNNPDIVVITGDLFDNSLEVKKEWLEPFKEVDVPILFSAGNHDCYYNKKDVVEVITSADIIYLNKNIYEFNGVRFVGIDYDENLDESLEKLKNDGKLNEDMPNVLLLHRPKKPQSLEKYNIFLSLTGHTHDGQLFPANFFGYLIHECMNGIYKSESGDTITYVNTGVGNTFFPIRTFTRTKISIITVEKNS